MRHKGFAALIAAVVAPLSPAHADDGIEKAGQAIAIGIPVTAAGLSLFKGDNEGLFELSLSTLGAVGTAYGLKFVVHEERPDHSNDRSFPSDTTTAAFAGATYLQRRYGWDYGLPAYALAAFVGYSRIESKQHHWWDVAAGAAIGWGWSALLTDRYENVQMSVAPGYAGRPLGFAIAMQW